MHSSAARTRYRIIVTGLSNNLLEHYYSIWQVVRPICLCAILQPQFPASIDESVHRFGGQKSKI